jgi:hypothetical protein
MSYSAEGEIYIPLEEFWTFVQDFAPEGETLFGPPRVTKDGVDMVVSFAVSNETNPSSWAEPPDVVKEWKRHRKGTSSFEGDYIDHILKAHMDFFGKNTYNPEKSGSSYKRKGGTNMLSTNNEILYDQIHELLNRLVDLKDRHKKVIEMLHNKGD